MKAIDQTRVGAGTHSEPLFALGNIDVRLHVTVA